MGWIQAGLIRVRLISVGLIRVPVVMGLVWRPGFEAQQVCAAMTGAWLLQVWGTFPHVIQSERVGGTG